MNGSEPVEVPGAPGAAGPGGEVGSAAHPEEYSSGSMGRFYAKVKVGDDRLRIIQGKRALLRFLESFDESQNLNVIIHSPKYYSVLVIRFRPDDMLRWTVSEYLYDPEAAAELHILNAMRQLTETDDKNEIVKYLSQIL